MKLQSRFRKALELRKNLSRMRIFHHLAPHFGVAGMERNIQRADSAANDAIQLPLVQIGQGHIIPHHKRHAPVVILDVQAASAAFGHLVDEAKHAVIFTGAHFVHQARGK